MNKRKIISGVLAICIFVLSMSMSFAVEVTNPDNATKAQALNKLEMLTGDGNGNYSLSSALKRSEAATFITKLMGKNDYLNQNKAQYINTGFTDVKAKDWYAAYVGYCKANSIISGLGNNMFGPKENVTEKAFLTMTMKVLGYTSDDFIWGNVYQKAFEIGLVTDVVYKDKKDDNKQYTRAEVVDVMHRALGLKIKNTNTMLIKKLVTDGVISSQKATDAGFIIDALPSNILRITPMGEQWLTISFNEPIRPILQSDILIYERDKKSALNFKIVSQTDTEIKLKTDSQRSGIEYVINIGNITDTEENVVKMVTSGFIGFENKGIKSDLFQISKVNQRSNSELDVYFTHPININAEQSEFYSVLQAESIAVEGNKGTISVKAMEDNTNAVIINTKNFVFQPDIEYAIKIKGSLISAYGTNLGLEAGDQMKFIGKDIQTEQFKLAGINSLNNKTIQLDFTKQVNQTIAEQVFSYYITEMNVGTPIQIIKATVTDNSYGKGCAVMLTTASPLEATKAYNLMINNASDITKQFKIQEQKFSFNASAQSQQVNTDLKVTSVLPIDLNCVTITFDRKIDRNMAEDVSNFSIICLSNATYDVTPIKAIYSSEAPNSVKLYTSYTKPMTAGNLYKIKVSATFQGYTGTAIGSPLEYNFLSNNVLKTKPEVVKAAFIAKDTIKISFSKDIMLDSPNILTQNYYIQVINDESTKKVPLAINYIDKNTIVLKFDKIEFTNQYYFMYNKIKDITGETYLGSQINTAIVQGE